MSQCWEIDVTIIVFGLYDVRFFTISNLQLTLYAFASASHILFLVFTIINIAFGQTKETKRRQMNAHKLSPPTKIFASILLPITKPAIRYCATNVIYEQQNNSSSSHLIAVVDKLHHIYVEAVNAKKWLICEKQSANCVHHHNARDSHIPIRCALSFLH